eukprot:CAMPEP_0175056374 /NCGR_PEP_ID=MMETSP0052_2-20121109/10632_1 /TAXON_ID=51329 ORGANISM="Polytomella parva, Strain SAG 63-3" /NCGR_SAMPLE_ID=MMETSP0052_2 /ASSEMBLY_ACC=CAM_ASM_000194 /LENGTH=447 /DNA_ID=CAMNT_0016321387 /DNA_START=199 /DNA_END=1543 /DNA_ORIENTATION=-
MSFCHKNIATSSSKLVVGPSTLEDPIVPNNPLATNPFFKDGNGAGANLLADALKKHLSDQYLVLSPHSKSVVPLEQTLPGARVLSPSNVDASTPPPSLLHRLGSFMMATSKGVAWGGIESTKLLTYAVVLPIVHHAFKSFRFVVHNFFRSLSFVGTQCVTAASRGIKYARSRRVYIQDLVEPPLTPTVADRVDERIIVRRLERAKVRLEYCHDCVVRLSNLADCELLLVGCRRLNLEMRDCINLTFRELHCGEPGDMIRINCPGFRQDIVCLRCACSQLQLPSQLNFSSSNLSGAAKVSKKKKDTKPVISATVASPLGMSSENALGGFREEETQGEIQGGKIEGEEGVEGGVEGGMKMQLDKSDRKIYEVSQSAHLLPISFTPPPPSIPPQQSLHAATPQPFHLPTLTVPVDVATVATTLNGFSSYTPGHQAAAIFLHSLELNKNDA